MKLVIDRKRWLRGEKSDARLLRPSDGKMCCLGFLGLACGWEPSSLDDVGEPSEVFPDKYGDMSQSEWPVINRWPTWLLSVTYQNDLDDEADTDFADISSSSVCGKLIEVNDDDLLKEADREREIARLFAAHGVDVEFVG